jgi:hypothetical protein
MTWPGAARRMSAPPNARRLEQAPAAILLGPERHPGTGAQHVECAGADDRRLQRGAERQPRRAPSKSSSDERDGSANARRVSPDASKRHGWMCQEHRTCAIGERPDRM